MEVRNFCFRIWLSTLMLCAAIGVKGEEAKLYQEPYRPQYHFTPVSRWIGDPCGAFKFNNKYMVYSWGGVETKDLVYWTELNDHAITGVPKGIATFTGSVVVDKENVAGYGKNAMIAAFTSYDEQTKKQSQSIAFSRDNGVTYQYYDLNPIIDIWSTEFRDPTIIPDPTTGGWVMLVAKALEKKVAFYGSKDLKHWEWLSDFGPLGDSEKSWECPDMFQLPVEGSDQKKWVMVVSINWAREQYFIGDFDGTKFIPDTTIQYPQYVDDGLDYYASRVFQDFDDPKNDDVYTIGWVNTWDYAPNAPSEWGKGIWSIPRKLSLYKSADGLRLRQIPAPALEKLRGKKSSRSMRVKAGTTQLSDISKMGNTYELHLSLKDYGRDVFGINFCEGSGRKVTLTYDNSSRYLVLDRTNSADKEIPKFDRISYVKIPGDSDNLKLTAFVDKSTIEIFVNDGEKVLTMLTFAADSQTGVSVFSTLGNTGLSYEAWPLKSIWSNVKNQ